MKNPVSSPKETKEEDISEKNAWEKKSAIPEQNPLPPPSASGIDYKTSLLFLKVAEFFGIDWKEYPVAVNKVSEIIDWAAAEVGSNNISDIILKIADTSRSVRSAAYSEKPYATLYRYIRLAADKKSLDGKLKSFPQRAREIKQEQQDIKKRMQAYKI